MKYKTYKNLSKESKEEWMFYNLNKRLYSPWCTIYTTYITMCNNLLLTMLTIFMLVRYNEAKYIHLIDTINLLFYPVVVIFILFFGSLLISLFNSIYLFYKERKLIKGDKK